MRYDFYIEGKGGRWFLLEVDGAYHYRNEKEDKEHYTDIVLLRVHDGMKDEYAKEKGIPLYRIPYNCVQEDLEKSLIEVLKQEGIA